MSKWIALAAVAASTLAVAAPGLGARHAPAERGARRRLQARRRARAERARRRRDHEGRVQFPPGFLFISHEPVAGWTVTVKMRKLDKPVEAFGERITEQVDTVTFTAERGRRSRPASSRTSGCRSDARQARTSLTFKALQTYDNGEVVRWIGAPDADEPAPQVKLAAAEGEEPARGGPAADAAAARRPRRDDDEGDDDGAVDRRSWSARSACSSGSAACWRPARASAAGVSGARGSARRARLRPRPPPGRLPGGRSPGLAARGARRGVAHAVLTHTTPHRGATVDAAAAARSQLDFNEPVEVELRRRARVRRRRRARRRRRGRAPGRATQAASPSALRDGPRAAASTRRPTASSRPTATRSRAASRSASASPSPTSAHGAAVADLLGALGRGPGGRGRLRRRPRPPLRRAARCSSARSSSRLLVWPRARPGARWPAARARRRAAAARTARARSPAWRSRARSAPASRSIGALDRRDPRGLARHPRGRGLGASARARGWWC